MSKQRCQQKNSYFLLLKSTKIDQLNTFFDVITTELTKCSLLTTDFEIMTKIVSTLITIDNKQLFEQSQLLQHQILIILRDNLIKFLFNPEQSELVTNLSILFHKICYGDVGNNKIIKLIIFKPLIDSICVFFDDIEKHFNEPKLIETTNRLMRIFENIEMTRFDLQENPI
jgi:hypothetical protein